MIINDKNVQKGLKRDKLGCGYWGVVDLPDDCRWRQLRLRPGLVGSKKPQKAGYKHPPVVLGVSILFLILMPNFAPQEFDGVWAKKIFALVEVAFARIVKAHAAVCQALIRDEARLGLQGSKIELACLKRARDAVLELAGPSVENFEEEVK